MYLFHPTGSSPIKKYQKKKETKDIVISRKEKKREAKGEQKEVKQILNETLFKNTCLKQPLHNFFGSLLSFTSITLALAPVQA